MDISAAIYVVLCLDPDIMQTHTHKQVSVSLVANLLEFLNSTEDSINIIHKIIQQDFSRYRECPEHMLNQTVCWSYRQIYGAIDRYRQIQIDDRGGHTPGYYYLTISYFYWHYHHMHLVCPRRPIRKNSNEKEMILRMVLLPDPHHISQ